MIKALFELELGAEGAPTVQSLILACPEMFRNGSNVWHASARRLRGRGADMSNWTFKHAGDSASQQLLTNLTILTITSRQESVHDLNAVTAWLLSEALQKPPDEILRPSPSQNRAKLHTG